MSAETDAAIRQWELMGFPERAMAVRVAVRGGEPVPDGLMNPNARGTTQTSEPPRSGKGSGVDAWREFAAANTDVEADVLDSMDRNDIIELLETREVIEEEGS